jgi:hypothetical protein
VAPCRTTWGASPAGADPRHPRELPTAARQRLQTEEAHWLRRREALHSGQVPGHRRRGRRWLSKAALGPHNDWASSARNYLEEMSSMVGADD